MSTTPVLGKRKRAEVSYAELNIDNLDDDLGEETTVQDEDQMSEDDATYGSRNKLRSTTKGKKRFRLSAAKPKKVKEQKPFPFLSLPPELRDHIYELAFTEGDGISLVSTTKSFRRIVCRGEIDNTRNRYRQGVYTHGQETLPVRENSLSPNLLAVNKQIHAEGLAWLYQQPLYLQDTMALHTFLAAIGPKGRQAVTDITVEGWGGGRGTNKAMNVAALTSMADCTNIKTFRLDCNIAWTRRPRDLARQLYRDGHYFFEKFGSVNGGKDAIIDVLELSENNFDRSAYYGWSGNNPMPSVEECRKGFRADLRKLLGC